MNKLFPEKSQGQKVAKSSNQELNSHKIKKVRIFGNYTSFAEKKKIPWKFWLYIYFI